MPLSFKHFALIGTGTSAVVGAGAGSYYLLQDKTIKHKLIREGHTLISNITEYQVSFKEFKDTEELKTSISTTQKLINAESSTEDGANALKTWCENKLETNLSDAQAKDLKEKLKKYCVKPPLTIEEKISKGGWSVITNWEAKFKKIKEPDEGRLLLTDLKGIDDEINDFSEGAQTIKAISALEKWCIKQKIVELISDENNIIWKKVENRCLVAKVSD